MNNLISNAIKYTNSGVGIVIGAYNDGEKMKVFVKDNGTEIVEAHVGTIYCESEVNKGRTFIFTLPLKK